MKNIPLSILSTNEVYTCSIRIVMILDKALLNDAYISVHNIALKEANSDLASAMGKSIASGYTRLLFAKDTKRDNAFISLREYISSECHGNDAARVAAAIKLWDIVANSENSIYSSAYVADSAKLESLFTELGKPEMTNLLQIIDATGRYEILKFAQSEFESTFQTKAEEESTINFPLLKNAKGRLSKELDWLLSYVESNAARKTDGFVSAEHEIDDVISDIVAIARARKLREDNKVENAASVLNQ